MVEPFADKTANPTRARVESLDLIRGVSVLGILAVNADGFAAPRIASLNPAAWPFPNQGWTALSYWVVDAFFHDKFVTLFSMLFGVSIFLVGGERSDRARGTILWRRIGALFLLSMLHGFGIWWGDILSLYAVTGAIMVFCRSWGPRSLLITGILLYGLMCLRALPAEFTARAGLTSETSASATSIALSDKRRTEVAEAIAQAKDSWMGAYRQNASSYLHILTNDPKLVPSTLGLMMIGLALLKLGFLSGTARESDYRLALAVGSSALVWVGWMTWHADVMQDSSFYYKFLELLVAPAVSIGYVGALMLFIRKQISISSRFAAVGRMAFTNYLMQSIIMTSIFYGGRGGFMGQVDRPTLWVVVVLVWVSQLLWSPWWLARFEMGPCEWAWRCLTYRQRVALRKK